MKNKKGLLLVVSGPSCVGKGTICKRILKEMQNIHLSVSDTTRDPRPEEIDGVHYNFIDQEAFDQNANAGKYLEFAGVHKKSYGTPKEYVEKQRDLGYDTLLEIDVQGALQVKENSADAILIFIAPPSLSAIEERFSKRNTETEDEKKLRIGGAKKELLLAEKYDYIVINDDLDQACEEVKSIIQAEHQRKDTMIDKINKILEEF